MHLDPEEVTLLCDLSFSYNSSNALLSKFLTFVAQFFPSGIKLEGMLHAYIEKDMFSQTPEE